MVPNGWKEEFLGDVAQFSQGVQVDAELQSEIKDDGLIRFLRISDYVNPNEVPRYISKPSDKYIVNKTDLSMIRYGSAGAGDLVRGLEGAIANNLFRVIPNENLLSKDFFWFYAHQPVVKNFLFSNSTSSTMPAISFKLVSKLPLLLPPLPEQQKIAKILTTWDKAISTTERLIDNSTQQKKALMQQLLTGKKRLLDDEGKRFEGEWLTKKLVDITTRIQRKSDGNDHPILTISSLSGFMTQKERYSRFMAGESLKKYVLLKNGEFAYNKGNSKTYQFGCIFKLEDFETGLVPNIYVCFKINNGLCEDFYKYLFEADYLKPQLGRLVNTGVRNDGLLNIRPDEFLNTTVPVPPIDEQQKIAAVLTNASREIELLEQQLADFQQEKKALMQQLLTGKKRVRIDEIV
ncbi:restriction endonuclease subunit S [Psychrobacter sp. Marseille-P5312]|uniref:restriction endonuclease subunit S n=1 Tax=Psychrobacter sp. Marseille-P5312 TaxID=2086574 RepID=UPI000CF6AA15|nr:restriction endonuclease subunit S [Psychrobacter sp. Marseille-P5312]